MWVITALLKPFATFVAKTWKLWIAVAILTLAWLAGRWYEERNWLEAEIQREQVIAAAVRERELELRQAHDQAISRAEARRQALAVDMEALAQRERQLRGELDAAELELVRPLIIPEDLSNECVPVLANPIGRDFIRLWNDYGRGTAVGTDTAGEAH